jgi:hypothetical protein
MQTHSALFFCLILTQVTFFKKKGKLDYSNSKNQTLPVLVLFSTYLESSQLIASLNVFQACILHERGSLLELVDPGLGSNYSREEALLMLSVALLCTTAVPTLRPKMSKVVSLLEGNIPLQLLLSDLALAASSLSSSGLRRNFWQNPSEGHGLTAQFSSNNTNESSATDNDDGSPRPLVS